MQYDASIDYNNWVRSNTIKQAIFNGQTDTIRDKEASYLLLVQLQLEDMASSRATTRNPESSWFRCL